MTTISVMMHSAEKVTSSGLNHKEANSFLIRLKGGDLGLSGSSTKSSGTINDPGLFMLLLCLLNRLNLTRWLSSSSHRCKQTVAALSFTCPDNTVQQSEERVKSKTKTINKFSNSKGLCDCYLSRENMFPREPHRFLFMSPWPEVGHRLFKTNY